MKRWILWILCACVTTVVIVGCTRKSITEYRTAVSLVVNTMAPTEGSKEITPEPTLFSTPKPVREQALLQEDVFLPGSAPVQEAELGQSPTPAAGSIPAVITAGASPTPEISSAVTSTPAQTGSLTVTPTQSSTHTAVPTATTAPMATKTPTVTIAPTATKIPTATAAPTATKTPAMTIAPTATITPTTKITPAPSPSMTPIPEDTTGDSDAEIEVAFCRTAGLESISFGDNGKRIYAVNKLTMKELTCTYKVADTSIAGIDSSGYITGKKPGTTTITASSHGMSMTFTVTIQNSVRYAYQSGDTSGLSETDCKILRAIEAIMKACISEEMSDYEKIKAVHDYIVLHTTYDETGINGGTIPAASYLPEGVLINHTAVCQGYTATMKLFADLFGIENDIIFGKVIVNGSPADHAWNLIKLEGAWYHLDITFDDPRGAGDDFIRYQYFLITDSMIKADHTWSTSSYPSCTAASCTYRVYKEAILSSVDDYEEMFAAMYQRGDKIITILYPEDEMPDLAIIKKYTKNYTYYEPVTFGKYTLFTVLIK